ncbi:hypothetical protein [Erythrobacter sp.]|jgi:hypothetical protein|uniref:hypothetical protein n=1 Tax=Erythrobacter sp. TaxID=1042 RepID=UPI002EA4716E|nr:hypothetical protein [Erythrobacter sp.]
MEAQRIQALYTSSLCQPRKCVCHQKGAVRMMPRLPLAEAPYPRTGDDALSQLREDWKQSDESSVNLLVEPAIENISTICHKAELFHQAFEMTLAVMIFPFGAYDHERNGQKGCNGGNPRMRPFEAENGKVFVPD